MVFIEIPMKCFPKKTKRASFRELLNELKSLSHNPNALEECFDDLEIHLMEMVELLKKNTLFDHGLAVEENNTAHQKNKIKYLEILSNLPVPPKRQKLSGRVGKGNESRKYFPSIKIPKNLKIATNFCKDFHNEPIAFKKQKIIDQNNGKVNLNKFHTAIIPRLPFVNEINTTLLENHCHGISFLDLLLLEVNLTKDELRRIKQYDANFKIGWLHDEVINSYFSVICKFQEKVLYCGTTEALLISHGKSFHRLWKNQLIQKDSVIIIPFNPTGYHWIFIQIDLCNRRYCIIDPLRYDIDEGSETFIKALFVIKYILQNKFGLELNSFNLEKFDHPLQNDFISCGVMVCYYAKRFTQRIAFVLALL